VTRLVLAGCGGIGRRHLEALVRLGDAEIFVVEPDPERRQAATAGFTGPGRLRCLADYDALPAEVEVAIVATTAATRRQAVESLLRHCRPRFLVLEKLLFQRPEDYPAVERLLAEAGVRTWVNCPRRLWPQYRALAAEIAPCPDLRLRVVGPASIGPATNAIHMLDLLAFLAGDEAVEVEAEGLDLLPARSKRGTLEFVGTLTARSARGASLRYETLPEGGQPLQIEIEGAAIALRFDESRGTESRATAADGWTWSDRPAPPVFQSRLTDRLVRDLLESGSCGLASYVESAALHLALLRALDRRLRALGHDTRAGVPVT